MQPKVELNKIRSTGEVVDDSILFIKQNWQPLLKAYFTICGLFWISGLIVSTFNHIRTVELVQEGETSYNSLFFISIIIEVINHSLILMVSLSFIVLYREKGNKPPTVEEVWAYVKFYFLRVTSSYFLLTIITVLGLVFCVFPGLYFMPVSALILTVMVIENASLRYANKRAFNLINDRWWNVFGVLILTFVLIVVTLMLLLIPSELIALLIVFLTGSHSNNPYLVALNVSLHLGQLLYLLPYIAMALTYFSLAEQKEDHNLLQRIEMLGTDSPEPDEPMHEEEY